jgi:predicted small metal-binding protein
MHAAEEVHGMAREFSCRCGESVQADDDDQLFTWVRQHADQKHPEMTMSDERIRQGIETMAKDVS